MPPAGTILPAATILPDLPEGWNIVLREGRGNYCRIRILPEGILEVHAPAGLDPVTCLRLHESWILCQVNRTMGIAAEKGNHEDLFLLDGRYKILVWGPSCEIREGEVVYDSPQRFKQMLVARLREDVNERCTRGIPRIGRAPTRITIRMQRSRWASCSGRKTLNFNLTMLALPPELREYIVLHELVHLAVPNHSPAFWEKLGAFCPDFRLQKEELKRYHVLVERNRIWSTIRTIP